MVEFDPVQMSLATLIEIHLHTHSRTSDHSMRSKYRSAVYAFTDEQRSFASQTIEKLQGVFDQSIITEVTSFSEFELNDEKYLDYYSKNPDKPFCKTFIDRELKFCWTGFPIKLMIADTRIVSQRKQS